MTRRRRDVLTLSLVLEAAGSWLRCQFQTAVVSFMKSMRPWPKLDSRNADHTWFDSSAYASGHDDKPPPAVVIPAR